MAYYSILVCINSTERICDFSFRNTRGSYFEIILKFLHKDFPIPACVNSIKQHVVALSNEALLYAGVKAKIISVTFLAALLLHLYLFSRFHV